MATGMTGEDTSTSPIANGSQPRVGSSRDHQPQQPVSREHSGSLSAHKVVLPIELLKDLEAEDGGKACLSVDDSENGFFYIPNFISEAEEAYLVEKIQNAPQPKWKALQARRLQYWGGQLSKQALIPEPLPDWLVQFPPLLERVAETGAFLGSKHKQFNHCLVNEYEPGQGIMPHEDGAAYFPAVATVSLQGHTLLDVYRYANEQNTEQHADKTEAERTHSARAREQDPRFSIMQERRSLLITRGSAYRLFLHGIAEREHDAAQHLATVTNGDMLADHALADHIRSAKEMPTRTAEETRPPSCQSSSPLPRTLRLSLTLRDVERVAPKSLLSMLAKR